MFDPLKPNPNQTTEMPLAKAWGYYFICLAACLVCGFIFWEIRNIVLIVIPYIASGIILNHLVFRNLVKFHPIYATLTNIANTKLSAAVTWPIFYVMMFIKIAIVKYL